MMRYGLLVVLIALFANIAVAVPEVPPEVVPEVELLGEEAEIEKSSADKAVLHTMKELKAWCQVFPPSPTDRLSAGLVSLMVAVPLLKTGGGQIRFLHQSNSH